MTNAQSVSPNALPTRPQEITNNRNCYCTRRSLYLRIYPHLGPSAAVAVQWCIVNQYASVSITLCYMFNSNRGLLDSTLGLNTNYRQNRSIQISLQHPSSQNILEYIFTLSHVAHKAPRTIHSPFTMSPT